MRRGRVLSGDLPGKTLKLYEKRPTGDKIAGATDITFSGVDCSRI